MAFPMKVAIASATRTAIGRAIKGTLRETRPDDLAAYALIEALRRVKGLKAADIEDVILGCAMPEAEQGLNVARNASFLAGYPDECAAQTVNRFCSSGLQAVADAAMAIHAGLSEVIVAGGVESMSMVPMSGNKVSLNPRLVDERPEAYIAMGHTAERIAQRFGVTRVMMDEFAANSHQKAAAAIKAGRFKNEIVPIQARRFENGKVVSSTFDTDECPRPESTVETLGKLRPAFSANGLVTAANSSPINDGAAAAVLLSDKKVSELGIKPIGYMRAFAVVGTPPDIMGIGPVPAIRKLLKLVGKKISDIDLFEVNEAFAAQALYCQRELEIPNDRINVNGGAIALGHPLGCTGARLTATILAEMERRNARSGIVSMCIGGGMGAAGYFERA